MSVQQEVGQTTAVLEVTGLTKHFPVPGSGRVAARRTVHAADDVTFTLRPGRITALVGESGSGKSTVARVIARLYDPTSGSVTLNGDDVLAARRRRAILGYRSQVQMIFQDPFASLNPVKTVEHHLARPLKLHHVVGRDDVHGRVLELLDAVGLVPPEEVARKFPHELSGGQRQRVAIARALAVEPSVILADEPISMLDVSIRIGILNLMLKLKREHNLAFLYVTHDIASARYIADDMLVMYAGQIVEHGPTEEVLHHALHPYTRLLLSAVPDPARGLRRVRLDARKGHTGAAVDPPPSCRFADRCPLVVAACRASMPALVERAPAHFVRCPVTTRAVTAIERTP